MTICLLQTSMERITKPILTANAFISNAFRHSYDNCQIKFSLCSGKFLFVVEIIPDYNDSRIIRYLPDFVGPSKGGKN